MCDREVVDLNQWNESGNMCTKKYSFQFSWERTLLGLGSAILVVLITQALLQKLDRCQVPTPNLNNPLPTLIK